MESTLRPRDIQARIRSGETPEAVAQAAQTSVDKIMAFAAPVLAERQHVAERAQRSSVRRSDAGQATGARTLGEPSPPSCAPTTSTRETVEWDAWRREDGRWSLTAGYDTTGAPAPPSSPSTPPATTSRSTTRTPAGWSASPIPAAEPPPARPTTSRPRASVASAPSTRRYDDAELPLGGDDAIDLVTEQPMEAFLDTEPPTDEVVVAEEAELREEAADAAAEPSRSRSPSPAGPPRSAAARPSRAGTRSCSAAATRPRRSAAPGR